MFSFDRSEFGNSKNAISVIPWQEYDYDKIIKGRLFFYVGAGLSQAAGLVGWYELARSVNRFRREYEDCIEFELSDADLASSNSAFLQNFITEKDNDGCVILSRESRDLRKFARTVVLNFLLRYPRKLLSTSSGSPSPLDSLVNEERLRLHAKIWETKCQGVFTTNYDMLLEESFRLVKPSDRIDTFGHEASARTYRYNAKFLQYLLSVPRFILKIHGDIDDLGTMLFDPVSAWKTKGALSRVVGNDLKHIFHSAQRSGHMIYVGCGARDRTFRELHAGLLHGRVAKYEKLFFVPKSELSAIIEEMSGNCYGLTFLTYGNDDGDICHSIQERELEGFLSTLANIPMKRPQFFSEEALDIWEKLKSESPLSREYVTIDWSARGLRLDSSWNSGVPDCDGEYLWRLKDRNLSPFLSEIKEGEDWWGIFYSVRLEGREILWRGEQPFAANGEAPAITFESYEWIGPYTG
ncbi:SIR2 family protein [bacterium AH-315-J21]|nr:SIR2 family protein [bacterium AH-315-J21]